MTPTPIPIPTPAPAPAPTTATTAPVTTITTAPPPPPPATTTPKPATTTTAPPPCPIVDRMPDFSSVSPSPGCTRRSVGTRRRRPVWTAITRSFPRPEPAGRPTATTKWQRRAPRPGTAAPRCWRRPSIWLCPKRRPPRRPDRARGDRRYEAVSRTRVALASVTIRPMSSATVGSSSMVPTTWPVGRMPDLGVAVDQGRLRHHGGVGGHDDLRPGELVAFLHGQTLLGQGPHRGVGLAPEGQGVAQGPGKCADPARSFEMVDERGPDDPLGGAVHPRGHHRAGDGRGQIDRPSRRRARCSPGSAGSGCPWRCRTPRRPGRPPGPSPVENPPAAMTATLSPTASTT